MKFCTPALLLGVGFAVGYFPWVPTLLRIPDHLLTEQLSSTVPLPDDPQASLQVSSTFLHASRLAGWRHRTKFATFLQMDDAEQLLNMPQRQTGSFLIVIPGKSDAQSQPPRLYSCQVHGNVVYYINHRSFYINIADGRMDIF